MASQFKHVSIAVKEPKKAAEALAEVTKGKVDSFHPVPGAYVCLLTDWNGEFIEVYPKGTHLVLTEEGAEFESFTETRMTSSTHVNLNVDITGKQVEDIGKRFGYKTYFRAGNGGPLWELWLDGSVLIELVTSDL